MRTEKVNFYSEGIKLAGTYGFHRNARRKNFRRAKSVTIRYGVGQSPSCTSQSRFAKEEKAALLGGNAISFHKLVLK